VDFFKIKLTQEGAAIDPTSQARGVSQNTLNNVKLPKRYKTSAKDSVEVIAANV
jgi:lambda repressor-like predicted transcriptional regulator